MIRQQLKLLWQCGACKSVQRSGASLHQIAYALNARGIATVRGGRWYAKSVSNVLARSA
jgi:Recombinase